MTDVIPLPTWKSTTARILDNLGDDPVALRTFAEIILRRAQDFDEGPDLIADTMDELGQALTRKAAELRQALT